MAVHIFLGSPPTRIIEFIKAHSAKKSTNEMNNNTPKKPSDVAPPDDGDDGDDTIVDLNGNTIYKSYGTVTASSVNTDEVK